MTTIMRPVFQDGQYIGAADLEAISAYAASIQQAHVLGAHNWGVLAGLDLVERPGPAGVEVWLTSGAAVDGFGRTLVLRNATAIGADLLRGKSSGAWFVWIGQKATPEIRLRSSYGVCDGLDAYARVAEDVAISVTGVTALSDQQSGMSLGGTMLGDARLARRRIDTAGPFQLDGSVPEQDPQSQGANAVWLIPLGLVGWDGARQQTRALTDPEKQGARLFRRNAGAVAEELLAPGGLIRLRDRSTFKAGAVDADVDALALAAAPVAADLVMTDGRASFSELFWVEGHSRMKGDVRLFAGKIEWRDATGASPRGPVYMERADTAAGDSELSLSIGGKATAKPMSRLIMGALDGGAVLPTLVVSSDARVGVGIARPELTLDIRGDFGALAGPITGHFGSATIAGDALGQLTLIAGNGVIQLGDKNHRVGINAVPAPGNALEVAGGIVQIDAPGTLRLLGSELIDGGDGVLRIRSGGATVAFDGGDNVGVNTAAPNPGLKLDVNGDFGSSFAPARMKLLGSEVLDANDGILRIRSGGAVVAFDGGDRIGVGTANPDPNLLLDVNGSIGITTGAGSLKLLGSEIKDGGDGVLRIRSGGATVAFDGGDNVGIGTAAPLTSLDVVGDVRFSGNLWAGSLLLWSDQRLKSDVQPIKDALGQALALQGVSYRLKPTAGKTNEENHFGFIADDVEKVFPDWVAQGPEGVKYIRVNNVPALTLEAVRTLADKVAALETRNEELSKRLAELERAAPETASPKGRE
jgi:Chaperone of endosialidase